MTDETLCGAETIGHCHAHADRRYIHDCTHPPDHHHPHECACGHTWTQPDQ